MRRTIALAVLVALSAASFAAAQTQQVSEPTGQKTLAATVGLYVFPSEGQAPEQQSKDEAFCYNWAVDNTQSDPFSLAKKAQQTQQAAAQQQAQIDQAGQGAGAKGAVAGAAAGALIGEIADNDAGEGAAWGAAIGAIGARRKARRAKQEAKQQVEQQAQKQQQATAEQIEGFKKAFGVCLEAKKYLVKF